MTAGVRMGQPGKRDEGWFTRIYAAEYAHVVRYGQRRLADVEASAELAQEVFVIARAEILRILADVPGFLWRGEVTDRACRKGVAITFDDRQHDAQSLLIFH